jgi:hypothetical protein
MSRIADDDQQQEIRLQEERDRWATKRVKPWGKPQKDDYEFRSWAKDASKELLEAGCIYEYARESRKLRCLLVLITEARKRRDFGRPRLKACWKTTYATRLAARFIGSLALPSIWLTTGASRTYFARNKLKWSDPWLNVRSISRV